MVLNASSKFGLAITADKQNFPPLVLSSNRNSVFIY